MRLVSGLGFVALFSFCLLPVSAHAAATCSTTAACGLNGTADGLLVSLDGVAGGPCYVQTAHAGDTATWRAEFWIRPLSLVNAGERKVWTIYSAHNRGDGVAIFRIDLYHLPGGALRVRMVCRQDDGSFKRTALLTLTNSMPGIEQKILAEWGGGPFPEIPGYCRITRQNSSSIVSQEVFGLDNDTFDLVRSRLGAVVGLDEGASGSYCLDELVEYR